MELETKLSKVDFPDWKKQMTNAIQPAPSLKQTEIETNLPTNSIRLLHDATIFDLHARSIKLQVI